jgi:hypothetical protein
LARPSRLWSTRVQCEYRHGDRYHSHDAATQFFLCEVIRQEHGGKFSLLGFYPGNEVVVPAETVTVTLSLACVFIFLDGVGSFTPTASLNAPSGASVLTGELPPVEKHEGRPLTATIQLSPIQTKEFGTFRVSLQLGEKTYERTFQILKGSPQIKG